MSDDEAFGWGSFSLGFVAAFLALFVFMGMVLSAVQKDGERICREISLVLPDQMALLKEKKVCP